MENVILPNEMLREILKRMPYEELIKACEDSQLFLSLCDWGFWNEKAQVDFEISSDYFNSLSKFDNGIGSFEELPCDKYIYDTYGWKKNSNKKTVPKELTQGFYRYFQIANRISLRSETFVVCSRKKAINPKAMFELESFFSRAYSSNQYQLVEFLADNTPISELAHLLNGKAVLTQFMEGSFSVEVAENQTAFFDTALEQIISPKLLKEFRYYMKGEAMEEWEGDRNRFYSYACQVQKGEIPEKYNRVIEENYLFGSEYYQFAAIFQLLLKKGEYKSGLVDQFTKLTGKIHKESVQEDGPYFLRDALKGGNLQFIQEILEMGDFFHCTGEEQFDRTQFTTAAYFSGKEEVIKIVSDANCPEISQDEKVKALIQGYNLHRSPERFLQRFVELGDLTDENLVRVTTLGDCDIFSHLLEVRIQASELSRDTIVLQFLEMIWYFLSGNLDLMAWAFRWFETSSSLLTKEEKAKFLDQVISSGPLSPIRSKFLRYHHYSPLSNRMISDCISELK